MGSDFLNVTVMIFRLTDLLYLGLPLKRHRQLLVLASLAGEQLNLTRIQRLPCKVLAFQLIGPQDLFHRSLQWTDDLPNLAPRLM